MWTCPEFDLSCIPTLEGVTNYEIWKSKCSSTLLSSGLWKFVDGSAKAPVTHAEETQYMFQERLELHAAKEAQARFIILLTCKDHIQLNLEMVKTAQECWEKLALRYAVEHTCRNQPVYMQNTWREFVDCTYNGENMEEFCSKYRAAVDKCNSAGIPLSDSIQVIHFVAVLHKHFPHWEANKREQMRRDINMLPKLDQLMNEIVEEYQIASYRVPRTPALPVFSNSRASPNMSARR